MAKKISVKKYKVYEDEDLIALSDSVKTLNEENDVAILSSKADQKPKVEKAEMLSTSPHFTKNILLIAFILMGIAALIGAIIVGNVEEITNRTIWMTILIILTAWFLIVSLVLILRTSKKYIQKKEEQEKFSMFNMSNDAMRDVILIAIGFILIGILVILGYWFDYNTRIISYSSIIIAEIIIVSMVISKTQNIKENPKDFPNFIMSFYLVQAIIMGVLVFFAIPLLMGVDLFENFEMPYINKINLQFDICMIMVSISGIIGILQMRRDVNDQTIGDDADYDKTAITRYLIMILLPILALSMYPISGSVIAEAQMASGDLSDYNYFNGIYVAIVSSRYTQFSMVIIIISALSIIIGKARGQSGSGIMVIGALGMAGVPMIISIMAFIGQVPAPIQFYELFGEGFANLIYAISYTSVISLALALVGVFYEIVPAAASGSLDD